MLARVCSAAVNGIEAYPVEVEVNVGYGDNQAGAVVVKISSEARSFFRFHASPTFRLTSAAWLLLCCAPTDKPISSPKSLKLSAVYTLPLFAVQTMTPNLTTSQNAIKCSQVLRRENRNCSSMTRTHGVLILPPSTA